MSWDVLVMNYQGNPPGDMDEMAEADNPDPLGKASAVRKIDLQTSGRCGMDRSRLGCLHGRGILP